LKEIEDGEEKGEKRRKEKEEEEIIKKKETSETDGRKKKGRQEKDKGGEQEKGETCRTGQPRRHDDGLIPVARRQRATRAEPGSCVAVSHRFPAVTGNRKEQVAISATGQKLSGPAWLFGPRTET